MIPLTSNIIAIKVPINAEEPEIVNTYRKELRYLIAGTENPLTGQPKHEVIHLKGFKTIDNCELLGVIGKGEIDLSLASEIFPSAFELKSFFESKGIDLTKEKVVIIKQR